MIAIPVTAGWLLLVTVMSNGDIIATKHYDTAEQCHGWVEAYEYVKKMEPDAKWTVAERAFQYWFFEELTFLCTEG